MKRSLPALALLLTACGGGADEEAGPSALDVHVAAPRGGLVDVEAGRERGRCTRSTVNFAHCRAATHYSPCCC